MALVILLIHHDLDLAALLRLDCALAPRAHHLRPDRMGEFTRASSAWRTAPPAYTGPDRQAAARDRAGASEGYSKADRLGENCLTSDGLLSGHKYRAAPTMPAQPKDSFVVLRTGGRQPGACTSTDDDLHPAVLRLAHAWTSRHQEARVAEALDGNRILRHAVRNQLRLDRLRATN